MAMTTNPLSAYRKIAPGKAVTKPPQSYQPQSSSNFEDWYKQNYGAEFGGEFSPVKPDDMDYNTWQAGQTLYDLYNTEKQAGEAYGQRIGEIDKQADFQNQQAYILAQKLQKYLGLTASAQGQKGIAAGDLIAAQTDYQNRLAGVASTAEGYRQEAYDTKQNAITAAKSGTQDRLSQLYAQQETVAEQLQAQQNSVYQTAVANTLAQMAAGFEVDEDTGEYKAEDYEKLVAYYDKNKNHLDQTAQEYIEFMLENDYPHGTPTNIEEATAADISEFIQGEISMKINGKLYKRVETTQPTQIGILTDVVQANSLTDEELTNGQYYRHTDGKEYIYYNRKLYLIEPTN